jgi:protein-disulfide isomerase
MGQFRSCFQDNTYAAEIQDDLDRAADYGVNGTPSVFVNGQRITPGYVPALSDLVSSIEAVLPLTE